MKPILPALLSALMVAGCTAPPVANESVTIVNDSNDAITIIDEPENAAAMAPADGDALSSAGLGALKIGMSRADVVAAFGDSSAANPDPEACEQFHPARAPAGVLVMLENRKLTRISLIEGAVKTDAGLGVGSTAAQVKAAYGDKAKSSPHKYEAAPAEYITVWTKGSGGPGSLGIVYEVGGDGKVKAIHAGGPAIQYVEGCA